MTAALVVLGTVVEGAAWWWIATRRASVWAAMTPVLVVLGAVALATGVPSPAEHASGAAAVAGGLGAGVALYAATRAFVRLVAPRWRSFREQSVSMYGRRGSLSTPAVLGLSVLVMVPGEELFWRGLALPEMQDALGAAGGALAAWAVFVLANLPSRNLAIVAGAAVGGAAWVALAWWSGGVVASVLSHAAWTLLMLVRPPLASASEVIP